MQNGSKAFVVYNGKILFVLRDNKPEIRNPNTWNLPGGRIEDGETWEEGLKRELQEEICIVPKRITYIGKRRSLTSGGMVAMYLCQLDDAEHEQVKLGNEGQELAFFTPEEVLKLPLADTKEYFTNIYSALVRIANGETSILPKELHLDVDLGSTSV